MIHGINGQMLIPLIGLILLIISFFAKVPEGAKYAAMLFGGIVLQVALGMVAHAVPALGFIHGFWALLLFWLAYRTAQAGRPGRPCHRDTRGRRGLVISRDRVRVLVGVVLTLAIVVPLGWMWWNSRLPVVVLRDGHGVRRLRRWPATDRPRHAGHGMEDMPGMEHASGDVSVASLDTPKDRPRRRGRGPHRPAGQP